MTIRDCLQDAANAGRLSQKGFEEYMKRMADAEALAEQRGLSGPAKYVFAVTEAAQAMERRATSKRAQVQQTILAIDRAWADASANTRGVGYGLTTVLGERVAGDGTRSSIVLQHRGNYATIQSLMSDYLSKVQTRAFGLRQNQALPQHLVSALYGRTTASAEAQASAQAWERTMKWWMDSMQAAGVPVRKLEDWRLPQYFDSAAVRATGKQGFVDKMIEWWEDHKLVLRDWEAAGDAYLVPGRFNDKAISIFEHAYDNITTNGDASLEPGALRANTTLADRYGRRRAFEWSSDGAWLEFNRTFGVGDDAIGELLNRHMDHISRDLAVAQTLGPDPDRAAQVLIQMYRKKVAEEEGGGGLGKRLWASKLEAIYQGASGQSQVPVSQRLALLGQSVRGFLSSVQLGGAVLSAPSDFAFTGATASWHGFDMTKIMGQYVSSLQPGSMEDRASAMRSGLILEVGMRGLHDAARDSIGDIITRTSATGRIDAGLNGLSRATGRLADFVIRAQGLAHHTQILRDAIGAQVQAHLSDLTKLPWDKLAAVDRRTFETYGLGQKEWDILRTKGVTTQGFMDPTILARTEHGAERDAGVKMLGVIASIQRIAVPEGNVVTRALVQGGTRPGTIEGEFLRSVAQYKGFPMASFMMHFFRGLDSLRDAEGQWFRGQYIAGLVVGATVLGAASIQLKNLAYGKDPEPMVGDPGQMAKFWSLAFAQGGAGGIFGDQLKALVMASRSGDPSRMMTPTAGLAADILGLTRGNLGQSLGGRDPHFGRDAVNFANKYTPDIWYSRLAMDRLVWDTLTRMADPEASSSFARMEERARREQGTRFYWRPGTSEPRMPDFGNVAP